MSEINLDVKWIECSLTLPPDQADMVSEALAGIFSGGLVQEREFAAVYPDQLDQVTAPVRIYGYIPAGELGSYKKSIAEALDNLPGDLPMPSYVALEERNWAAAWQDRYHPIPIGEKLIIVPRWLDNPEPERLQVLMDPGLAFGSGTHPTTQLTLALLEKTQAMNPQPEMIEIGCGSGIVSIAAAKLGVRQVVGVDIDPEAVRVSRENSRINQTEGSCEFGQGSVRELLDQQFSLSRSGLVAANMIAPILAELFSDGLGDLVSPEGTLILSGILEEQLNGILDLLEGGGFSIRDELEQEGWYAIRGDKSTRDEPGPQV